MVDAHQPVPLVPMASGLSLQGQVDVLEDPTGRLRVEELLDTSPAKQWTTPSDLLRLYGPSTWWLRLRLQAPATDNPWILAFPTTAIRDIAFHGPLSGERAARASGTETGLIRPYASRPLGMERITYPLHFPETGDYTVLIRMQNTVAQNITPTAWLLPDYLLNRQHKRLFDGLTYGVLLTLLIYNLALAVVFRDLTYGSYVLTCAAALLTIATFNGHTAHYLWPAHPWWIEHSYQIWPALWLAISSQLPISQTINEGLALGGIALVCTIAVWLWRRGHSMAPWYLCAHLTLFVCVVGVVAVARGWWNAPFVLSNGLQIGIAAEMVVLAVALSARIRRIQQEKAMLRLHASSLVQAVHTDPLTGLLNRRGLSEQTERLLAHPGQHAVLLFDLDRFKPINDTHGHEIGDQVLVEIGQRLAQQCRLSDMAARLGGDEFVVVLAHCPPRPALDRMVQHLCDAVDRPMEIQGVIHQVNASAGVALTRGPVRDLKSLLRSADQAMYAAKRGQTRFSFAAEGEISA